MNYSREVVRRARHRLDIAKADYDSQQESRLQEMYNALPRIREIDRLLQETMALAAQNAFLRGEESRDAFEAAKQANIALRKEREQLIGENFPADYLQDGPICPHCGGSGYIGSQMCQCLDALCRQELAKEISLLSRGAHAFSDFSLDYYSTAADPKYGVSPRVIMSRTLDICREYATNFSPDAGNLLFNGGTGLGKTMLSACIAKAVSEKGYSLCYYTAAKLFSVLEAHRFRPDEDNAAAVAQLYNCDLLIMDDLGTELAGNFVTSALYALLNSRILDGKPMVISTNLNISEIRERYSPQIASRLEGNFRLLPFVGEDIRVLKNK